MKCYYLLVCISLWAKLSDASPPTIMKVIKEKGCDPLATKRKPIGGLLTLVVLELILSITFGVIGLINLSTDIQGSDGYVYYALPVLLLSFVALACVVLYFMIKRRLIFRTIMVIQLSVNTTFVLSSFIYLNLWGFAPAYLFLVPFMICVGITIPYLYRSKRVQQTFN